MAVTFGFYNSVNHDRKYDAIQFGNIFDGIIHDGVYETYKKALLVKQSNTANTVIIQPGRAWFNHTWTYNDADLPLKLMDPPPLLNRYDAVVLDVDQRLGYRRNSFTYVAGTAATNPVKPTLINTSDHHQYPLAYVYRRGGVTNISIADIENTVGTSACPFVLGVISYLTVDELLAQWTAQFSQYIIQKQNQWSIFQTQMEQRITNYENTQESEWTTFQTQMEQRISTFESQTEAQFFQWMENEQSDFTAWRNSQQGYFSNWMATQQTAFNNWMTTQQSSFTGWMSDQKTIFETWMMVEQSDYTEWRNGNTTTWTNWFNHIQGQLDSDAAGHLQNQIDAISFMYVINNRLYLPNTGASVNGTKLYLNNHN